MSQFVETRVGDFLGRTEPSSPRPAVPMPRPVEKKEEAPKEIAAPLSADQIFTF
jgi:hypothetical protein